MQFGSEAIKNGMEKRFLNINQLADYLGLKKGTLYVWVCQKRIPYVKIGGLLRFNLQDIDLWVKARSVAEFD